MASIATTCPYCGVGCGVLATPDGQGGASIAGDPAHPANFGRLCSKGAALGQTLGLEERLLAPVVDGVETDWDTAIGRVADGFAAVVAEHGPEAVAFYVSGQLLTEDYYVANKLMKGFIGAANIDSNSRLCMASAVAGHRRAFGSDTVPCTYEDLELADLVVLVGSNLAWCHPVLFQRLQEARAARGTKVVVIDPRRTVTAEEADLHLPVAPGGDVALFLGLLAHLARGGHADAGYLAEHTDGGAAALAVALAQSPAELALAGIEKGLLARFFALFAASERVVTMFSQGVNQSSAGTDKVNAILNCHLYTGRIGRPGMGPFSVTGQPNAMGGREVGGLANLLAAHMEIDSASDRASVQKFWGSPTIAVRAGLKAVDLFGAIRDGRVKAVWIMATNPVTSLPMADEVAAALAACPLVVVSDVTKKTDTARFAHVLLPAAGWGEKDGTVTNSERRISRQRRFLAPVGEARADWRIICQVAQRMGFAGFEYDGPAAIWREHASLTRLAGRRDFDLGGLAGLSDAGYAELAPVQWPVPEAGGGGGRFFGQGGFYTADRRARLVPTPALALAAAVDAAFPLLLNTGRVRDQWHSMTRTGLAPRLLGHVGEPFVAVHPDDAAALDVAADGIAEVVSAHGRALLRVVVSRGQRRGEVFAPIHWTGQHSGAARVDALIGAAVDPHSGQPEFKAAPVAVRRFAAAWHGFAVSAARPSAACEYWAAARAEGGWRIEMAGAELPEDWPAFARALFGAREGVELLAYHDWARGVVRFGAFEANRLVGALFVAREPVAVARAWVATQLEARFPPAVRLQVLAGRPGGAGADDGALLCACHGVGVNKVAAAVAAGAASVAAVGAAVAAGTGCGACRPEIGRIIDASRLQNAS